MYRWTMVLSEYLDLPVILRECGEPVVSVRSALEAMECLENWAPAKLVVDASVSGSELVVGMVKTHLPEVKIEPFEDALDRVLLHHS